MSPHQIEDESESRDNYLEFPSFNTNDKGEFILNRHSTYLTRGHEFPPAKAMLYGTGIPDEQTLQSTPQVGIAHIWWEGNPCNMHMSDTGRLAVIQAFYVYDIANQPIVLDLGKTIKDSVTKQGLIGFGFSTIGVSDGITMGHAGMRFSLQSREIIADSIETVVCAHAYDAVVAIPGCDKNMPGVVMGLARINRPAVVVYGGTQRGGFAKTINKPIDMNTPSEARGAYVFGKLQDWCESGKYTAEEIMCDIEKNAVPGPGGCGGMFTANSLATVIETLGLSLPGSASAPGDSATKMRECSKVGDAIRVCLEKNIRPSDILTRKSFENALTIMMALGGSTNVVLHTLAMAKTAEVELSLDDFQRISSKTPFIANMSPSGRYNMEDLFNIGGIPSVIKYLIAGGLLDGSTLTVTGKTLADNVVSWPSLPQGQEIIRSLDNPIKSTGHIEVLRGNIAPGGAVAKITGKQGLRFTGKARVFNKEKELDAALNAGVIPRDENIVLVVRYEGPKGGPGMPEQLRASGALIGGGYTKVALITDGRYSGASHGFIIGHIVPEAAMGGPIAVIQDDDVITIDAETHRIDMVDVTDAEIAQRLKLWKPPKRVVKRGTLAKYAQLVGTASEGAVTDWF